MTNLINEHFVFVSQILPDILSRTCELPFAAGSFVFVCVYLQEEQQILIKKLWKQQKSQKTQTPETEKQSQKKCLSWLWGKQEGGGRGEWNKSVRCVWHAGHGTDDTEPG